MTSGPMNSTQQPVHTPRWSWLLALLAPLLALAILKPWLTGAFPVWDFGDMLPILAAATDVPDAVAQLAAFTRADGRANYLTYLQVATTWEFVGDDPGGWQWQRAILMLVLGGMFSWTALRLGSTAFAAGVAGLLVVISVSGTEGWLFLVGEPLAAILLLSIVLLGQHARRGAWSGRHVVGLALLCLGVMLAKEVAGVMIPVALLLGAAWNPEKGVRIEMPRSSLTQIGIALSIVLSLELVSFASALLDATQGAYATNFQPGLASLTRWPTLFQAMLVPVRFVTAPISSLLYPANLAWLVLGGLALVMSFHAHEKHRRAQLVLILLAAPLLGAMVYSFWPRYSAFYGIPFILGSCGLFAAVLTQLCSRGGIGRVLAVCGAIIVLAYTGISSHRIAGERRAFADLALATVRVLDSYPPIDTLLVVKPISGANRWPVSGAELRQYSLAMNLQTDHTPAMVDANCAYVARRLSEPLNRLGVLNDQNNCGPLPTASVRLVASLPYIDWFSLTQSTDTLVIQLLLPDRTPG